MKLHVVACMVSLAVLVAVPSALAQADKLIGVWKAAEIVDTDVNIPEMAKAKGLVMDEKGPMMDVYMVFTKKYRFVVGSVMPNRKELPENPTASQLVAAWEPVWAFAWAYEVKGNTVITRQLFSKNPIEEPMEHSYPLKFDGDDLIWTFGVIDGKNTVTQRYTRLE